MRPHNILGKKKKNKKNLTFCGRLVSVENFQAAHGGGPGEVRVSRRGDFCSWRLVG